MWHNTKKNLKTNSKDPSSTVIDFDLEKIAKIGGWYHEFSSNRFEWTDGHYDLFELSKDKLFSEYQAKIHPDDIKQLEYLFNRAKNSGEGYVYSHRVFFDEGKRIKYVKDIAIVNKDSNGKPVSICGTCQDVSDTMPIQEQSQFVLQSFSIGLWQFDFVKNILIWDESTYKLYGLKSSEFTNALDAWKTIISDETFQKAQEEVFKSIAADKEYYSTFMTNHTDNPKHIGIRGTTIKDQSGQPIKMYGMSWDRTQEILNERTLESERAKSIHSAKLASLGEMSASVAHEINNPLAVISATLQLIKKFKDDPIKFDSKVETLKKSVERISKIVNGLRKFSKTTNKSHYKEVYIKDVLDEAINFVDYKIKKYELNFKFTVQNNFMIYCDPVELEQVIINLINNSVDAVKNDQDKWIDLKCFVQNEINTLQIIDSGHGISKAEEDKIFQPFYTTKQLGEGTGLGLSITKGILDQHKAKIFINHDHNNTCFEIHFPTLVDESHLIKKAS